VSLRRGLVMAVALGLGLAGGGTIGFLAQGQPRTVVTSPSPKATATASGTPQPNPTPSPVTADTLLAWTPGGLPDGFGASVDRLPGVDHVVSVLSGTAWLTRSLSAEGDVVDQPPQGLAIPLEVAGADLSSYGVFLSPADRAVLPALSRGEAVLGATSAKLRGIGVGGMLIFGHVKLRVAGVLPDTAVGAHEVFVSRDTAARLGVSKDRYLLIDPRPKASRAKLSARIRGLLPPGGLVQIRGPGETPFFRQGDAVLPPVQLKVLFGEFAATPVAGGYLTIDPAWVATHIVVADVPVLGHVRCNRALIPQLRGALAEIEREGLARLLNPADYAGCYSPRFLNRNPEAGISHHAWGVALDTNVSANPFGETPHQDPRIVAIFGRWGFTWGGSWLKPDGMHFEFQKFAQGA
jgi:hypothetical protein